MTHPHQPKLNPGSEHHNATETQHHNVEDSAPEKEEWWIKFAKIIAKHYGEEYGSLGAAVEEVEFIENLLSAQRQQAAEEATRKERERCLECVELLTNKRWIPKAVPIKDGELDTIQGILDNQNKRVIELEKAVTASDTWDMALNQIRDKIKNG